MLKTIHTKNAPDAIGPYNQAKAHGNTLYISGQIGLSPETGKFEHHSLQEETHQVLKNLGAILKAAGADYDTVIKCSIFIRDMSKFAEINEVYASYFTTDQPARETVEVSQLPAGAMVEISAIAALD
jgi:2-iminobutanoate/2-iminopropanoate deaminase